MSTSKATYKILPTDPATIEFTNISDGDIEIVFTTGSAAPIELVPNQSEIINYEFPMCWAVNCEETGPDCPDPRLTVAPVVTMNNGVASAQWTTNVNMPGLFCAWPASDPSNVFEAPCQLTSNFGDANSPHLQSINLSSLPQNTDMVGVVKTTSNPQVDCASTSFDEVLSCEFNFNIGSIVATPELKLADFSANVQDSGNASEITTTSPAPKANNPDNQIIRVNIVTGTHWGHSGAYLLDPSVKTAWARWYQRMSPNFSAGLTSSLKNLGFMSHFNGGSTGIAGGNGGGWAGLCKSWSARTMFDPVSGVASLRIYHYDLDNNTYNYSPGSINDHPCITNGGVTDLSMRNFGKVTSGGNDALNKTAGDGQWHCIEQEIVLNTLSTPMNDLGNVIRDGSTRFWIDGNLAGSISNRHWTNNPAYHNISLTLQNYYGGSPVSPTNFWAEFDCIEVSDTGRIGC